MPYIKRDEQGYIVAVSRVEEPGFDEEVSRESPELSAFLASQQVANSLDESDQDFVRVLEDVVELLIARGVILFTDLPRSAQEKIMRRQKLRNELSGELDLIGDD